MKKAVLYIHGRGGNPGEAEHYRPLFPDCDVFGAEYPGDTPWEAAPELSACFDDLAARYGSVVLIANSIGAYFAVNALRDRKPERAFFISPVADMEKLILGMMAAAGVTGEELRLRGEIPTAAGETLSWEYLSYVRAHPLQWSVPTAILYGENDALTDRETMEAFARKTGASLTVMPGGEHWFHTEEQMRFSDAWMTELFNQK